MKSGSERAQQNTSQRAEADRMRPAALRQTPTSSPQPGPLDASPWIVAQRQRLDSAFGPAIQRQPEEEEQMRDGGSPLQRQAPLNEASSENEELQLKAAAAALQCQPTDSAGGLPAGLKTGIESLSGFDMSDVRVHANSSRPAEIGALAYTQGKEIHLGPGQQKHLPHEAWHLVQQRQGRVKPTMQAKGVAINDDQSLEMEADVMGEKARKGNAEQKKASLQSAASYQSASPIQKLGERLEETNRREFSVDEYIRMWEREQGRKVTAKEKEIIKRGCVGITEMNLYGEKGGKPLDQYPCGNSFEKALKELNAWKTKIANFRRDPKLPEAQRENWQKIEAVIYGKWIWSGNIEQAIPNAVNYDYGFWDEASQAFWHANHGEPKDPKDQDRMRVYQSSRKKFEEGYADFNTLTYYVAFAQNYDPRKAAGGS